MPTPHDIVLTSLIGDALALGPHWVYDQAKIEAQFGRVDRFHPPLTAYHPGKAAGDLTHYGDQILVLLRTIQRLGRWDLATYAADWRAYWEDPATISYRDGATRETLANLQSGISPEKAASHSHDLAGAGRISPLFLLSWQNDEELIAAARQVTGFTHGDPAVVDAAEFFARLVLAVQRGAEIPSAISSTMPDRFKESFTAGCQSATSSLTDAQALAKHGLSCDIAGGLPSVIHLFRRYPEDPAAALIANATAGGDSAARGTILGMIYGARFPVASLPAPWLAELKSPECLQSLSNS